MCQRPVTRRACPRAEPTACLRIRMALRVEDATLLQCVAVCCSVLQCGVVCCSAVQCVAVCQSQRNMQPSLPQPLVGCSVLALRAGDATLLHCVAVCCSVLQCVVVCCSALQCVAVCQSKRVLALRAGDATLLYIRVCERQHVCVYV